MATTTRHEEISDRFLEHAREEFDKGDMLQASEKAWGAVAHYVKSVAKARGWPDGSHWDIANNARKLLDLTPDPDGNRDEVQPSSMCFTSTSTRRSWTQRT